MIYMWHIVCWCMVFFTTALFSRNPYNIECFAQYGGPVDPALALGGFLKDNEAITDPKQYQNATAAIITILLNNHHNKSLLGPALEWESR